MHFPLLLRGDHLRSGIIYDTIWGSFEVLGSFAVQFGDHLRYEDHLQAGIICGAVQFCIESQYITSISPLFY